MLQNLLTDVNTGFNGSYLTKEEIKKQCPVAFSSVPTNPTVTNKYVHVNTEVVINDLEKLGWKPVEAKMRKRRTGVESVFSPHVVSFQNPNIKIKGEKGDDAFPRIILFNSHDGFSSFKFFVGIYRLVCSNGLIVADEEFSNFKIRHMGYSFEELREMVKQAVEDLPEKVEIMNKMKQRELTEEEKHDFALNALLLRSGIKPGSEEANKKEYDEETIKDILDPLRDADKGDSLWNILNVVQEKVIKGGFQAALRGGKVRKVKKIKSFETDIRVNQELFKSATALVN